MNIPPNHFPNDPPFDTDFDPNDDAMASEWSPVDGTEDGGTHTAIKLSRKSQTAKNAKTEENVDNSDSHDLDPVDAETLNLPVIEEVSSGFISSWNRLISMTNWEKGKLIHNWRSKLIETGVPRQVYSDESLAKRLGNVSGQHIGRLRRVFERFGDTFEQYSSLFWSHFQAVLDWDDAENWLNDASENQWSVATMRLQRWESLGSPAGQRPNDADIVMSELDEDVNPYNDSDTVLDGRKSSVEQNNNKDKKKKNGSSSGGESEGATDDYLGSFASPADAFAQMKQMKDLPDDLKEAFEQLKVVILSHKVSGWREVEPQRILTFLNAMKVVVMTEEK